MEVAAALARLEAAGTEQNRRVFRRHGARDPLFGVSFGVLHALAKEARPDAALARAPWETRACDARGAGNRTRHSMNGALIAIGLRNPALRAAAEAVAGRNGPVRVDHGRTGCVTPPAIPYIAKAWARRAPRVEAVRDAR